MPGLLLIVASNDLRLCLDDIVTIGTPSRHSIEARGHRSVRLVAAASHLVSVLVGLTVSREGNQLAHRLQTRFVACAI
jgi:hypothetical protein